MPSKRNKMSEDELAALLDGQINDALDYDRSDLSALREKALKYYEGEIDIPSARGRSSVVSRDVSDTHGLIMPGLTRVFLNAEKVVDYQPTRPEFKAATDPKTGKPTKIDLATQKAAQATDLVNYVAMKECDGYRQLRNAMHDGVLLGNGILKHWWDKTPTYTTEDFTGLSDDAYTLLLSDPDVEEVLEHSEYPDPGALAGPSGGAAAGAMGELGSEPVVDPSLVDDPSADAPIAVGGGLGGAPQAPQGTSPGVPAGTPQDSLAAPPAPVPPLAGPTQPTATEAAPAPPAVLHDCKIKRKTSSGRLKLMALPPEEFMLDRNAVVLDEEHARFAGHRYIASRSDLIKRGYKRDIVEKIPIHSAKAIDSPEEQARDRYSRLFTDNAPDPSTELVEVYECYVQVDYDGDGVAEWRKIVRGGPQGAREFLENEEWGDDLPFSDIVPEPVPHRWRGRSIFDEVEDVMKIKTVLQRQVLDNIYQVNNPRQIATVDGVANPDVLINWTIGDTIWEKTPNSVRPLVIPFVARDTFPVMEYFDGVVEKRTGVSKASMALDMEALQNQTATAVNANQAAAHTKVEEYARNIAECGGLRRVFKSCLKLIVKHQDRPRTIRLRDDWVEMDPRSWNAEMDVTINTGLGSGSRERDMTMLQGVAMKQEQIILQLGPSNPVCDLTMLAATYRKMAEAGGLRSPEQFFKEVGPEDLQRLSQAKPDPKMQELQAKMQLEQQKLQMQSQADQAATQAKMQSEQAKAQFDAQMQQAQMERQAAIEERQAQGDIATQQAKTQSEMQLEQAKFEFAKKLKMMELFYKARSDAANQMTGGQSTNGPADELRGKITEEGGEIPDEMFPAPTALDQALAGLAQGQQQLGEHVMLIGQHLGNLGQHAQAQTDTLARMHADVNKKKAFDFVRHPKTNRIEKAVQVS
jgi:hypothetical protein